MCKALSYVDRMNKIYGEIEADYFTLTSELKEVQKWQQDLLHDIENSYELDEFDSQIFIKLLQENRRNRRAIKNELQTVTELREGLIANKHYVSVNNLKKSITQIDTKLINLAENKVYNHKVKPKIVEVDGVSIIHIDQIIVPDSFVSAGIREDKYEDKFNYYREHKRFMTTITIDKAMILQNGYITYKICQQLNKKFVEVVIV